MPHEPSFVAVVNDDRILASNLARSPRITERGAELQSYRGFSCASAAYNAGLAKTSASIVVFVHQDVYLPTSWWPKVEAAMAELSSQDPDWAVLGSFGVRADGQHVGRVWSTGLAKELDMRVAKPEPVVSVDELVIVLRRESGLCFDEKLPGFHLYGTDIVQTALARGLRAYVVDAPVVHNSRTRRSLGGAYTMSYRYMERKWRDYLPIPTTVVPITRSGVPLWRAHARLWVRRRIGRIGEDGTRPDPVQIARRLGYE